MREIKSEFNAENYCVEPACSSLLADYSKRVEMPAAQPSTIKSPPYFIALVHNGLDEHDEMFARLTLKSATRKWHF